MSVTLHLFIKRIVPFSWFTKKRRRDERLHGVEIVMEEMEGRYSWKRHRIIHLQQFENLE